MEEINEEIKAIEIIEHIKDLFNDEQEKNRFLDYIAKTQSPEQLESMKEILKKLLLS
jgi:uncharacterized protein YutD